MKFSFFNLFAIVTIIALTLGWATERSRRLSLAQSYAHERQQMKVANRSIGAAIEACSFAAKLKSSTSDQWTIALDANLINHTLEIWQNRDSVSYTLDQTHCAGMTSQAVTSMLLNELQCRNPEDFWVRVSGVRKADKSLLPDDLSDVDCSDFTSYLQESIDRSH